MRKHGLLIAFVAIGLLFNWMPASKADNPLTPACALPMSATFCDNTGALKAIGNLLNTGITTTTSLAPASSAATVGSVTVTSSSAQALAGATRKYLLIKNESASAFIACRFAGTAALNTAGSITLAPYAGFTWESSYVPSDAVNCISSAATSPATFVSN